ncbi:MAG: serine hydrolase [Bryobacteraceae bacterium]|nr:serine hydrolase [Bryobacteraceae bacterium]
MLRVVLLLCFSASLAWPDPAGTLRSLAGFDAAAEKALDQFKVPGAAVGIIQDGKVILAKGYGYRDLVTKKPVTSKTVFATGSVTKSFTAIVLATLADEGKLDWDKPVRQYLPWFRMYDPVATELVNVRDMLSHRTGLPRHDFIRFSTHLTREELVRRIRYLEPNRTFRDAYQYNNLMYTTAGYLAGVLAGATWEELVETRIFKPLGMTRSSTSTLEMQHSDDFAKPHLPSAEGPRETGFYVYQKFGVGPNGAVNSSVEDLLKYLQMYLDGGKPVLSRPQLDEVLKPVTVTSPVNSYALGWQTGFYRGHRRIEHGGAITGFRAHAILLPEQNAAVIALINSETGLATRLAEELSDRILGLPPLERPAPGPSTPRPNTMAPNGAKLPRPIEEYAGTYSNPAYGPVRVEAATGALRVRFDATTAYLKPSHDDTFEMREGAAQFKRDEKGQVREMHLPLEPAVKPFVFVKD